MAHTQDDPRAFSGFGVGTPARPQDGVFILALYRDGQLTATAHATERGAMEAVGEYLEDNGGGDDDERGGAEDRFAQVQQMVSDEGGVMEIIASPVYGL